MDATGPCTVQPLPGAEHKVLLILFYVTERYSYNTGNVQQHTLNRKCIAYMWGIGIGYFFRSKSSLWSIFVYVTSSAISIYSYPCHNDPRANYFNVSTGYCYFNTLGNHEAGVKLKVNSGAVVEILIMKDDILARQTISQCPLLINHGPHTQVSILQFKRHLYIWEYRTSWKPFRLHIIWSVCSYKPHISTRLYLLGILFRIA